MDRDLYAIHITVANQGIELEMVHDAGPGTHGIAP